MAPERLDQQRFLRLWQRFFPGTAVAAGERAFERLEALYTEPERAYHNASHVTFCLSFLDRYRASLHDPDSAELALWFHDAAYGPNPQGHESRSAELLRSLAGDALAESEVGGEASAIEILRARLDNTCALIEATTHKTQPRGRDAALVVDIDLASFCRPWHQFLKDTMRCRVERQHLPDREFCYCQVDFLQSLLDRPTLYYSEPFRRHHESRARANISRLIGVLQRRVARWEPPAD